MMIVDQALARRASDNKPVLVAIVGAGYMARCIAVQIVTANPGMRLVAIANRTLSHAGQVYNAAGIDEFATVSSVRELEQAIAENRFAVTDDPSLVCRAGPIEAVIEVTGHVTSGTVVAYDAIQHGKHVVMLNAEVDGSVGPMLQVYAEKAGVVYTYTDGDEPGVAMNLYRLVESMGCKPMLVGQLKGFLNRYRNPETQREFAATHQVNPQVVASFADGSKLALEATIMGNATGFAPIERGMRGHQLEHVNDMIEKFPLSAFENGGLVEYALGAAPHTGAFVMAYNEHPLRRQLMSYLKMGPGPLHLFYTPYHLPPMQLPHSVARAVLFNDTTISPRGAPTCDTISFAKRDLRAGEVLDGSGGFTCYGVIDRYDVCRRDNYLPIGISLDCKLVRNVAKDQPISYADIELPKGRLCDQLRDEMISHFSDKAA